MTRPAMFSRIALILITLFWMTMNYLLWRSEFGGRNHVGTSVPVEVVWRKILTAPDASGLGILHHGRPIGHGVWSANIGQDAASRRILSDEPPPEDMPEEPTGYRIDYNGIASVVDAPGRLHFNFDLKLSTNQLWQEFTIMLRLHSSAWEIHSLATEQAIHLKLEDEGQKTDNIIKFADLQNPQALGRLLDLPVPLEFLGAMGLPSKVQNAGLPSVGLTWEARNDWITIGHTFVRAYRLQAPLFDRYKIVVIVSLVGEILRVELPDEWVLVNDQLTNL